MNKTWKKSNNNKKREKQQKEKQQRKRKMYIFSKRIRKKKWSKHLQVWERLTYKSQSSCECRGEPPRSGLRFCLHHETPSARRCCDCLGHSLPMRTDTQPEGERTWWVYEGGSQRVYTSENEGGEITWVTYKRGLDRVRVLGEWKPWKSKVGF